MITRAAGASCFSSACSCLNRKREHGAARGATSHWSNVDLVGVSTGCLINRDHLELVAGGDDPGTADITAGLRCGGDSFLFGATRLSRVRRIAAPQQGAHGDPPHAARGRPAGVALLGTWGSIQWALRWPFSSSRIQAASRNTRNPSAFGAIVFPIIAGVVAEVAASRVALCVDRFVLPAALSGNDRFDAFLFSIFLAGGITAAFYGWFLFARALPHRRARNRSGFAYNFGRILAAVGGLQTATSWDSSAEFSRLVRTTVFCGRADHYLAGAETPASHCRNRLPCFAAETQRRREDMILE